MMSVQQLKFNSTIELILSKVFILRWNLINNKISKPQLIQYFKSKRLLHVPCIIQ